jgi:hypothetical protein
VERRSYRGLPLISVERVQELARLGTAIDGREPVDAAKNARIMKYQRESPPLDKEMGAWLEELPTIRRPTEPGIYLLWSRDRVVYVGRSEFGLFGHTIADHHHGARAGVLRKEFDRISLLKVRLEALDVVFAALIRTLRPKYNRTPKTGAHDDQARSDRELLLALGLRRHLDQNGMSGST